MSFAGHVMDMIKRSKYNRNLLVASRKRRKNLYQQYNDGLQSKGYIKNSAAPRVICEQVKAEIRQKIRKEQRKRLILIYGVFMFIIVFFILVASYFM